MSLIQKIMSASEEMAQTLYYDLGLHDTAQDIHIYYAPEALIAECKEKGFRADRYEHYIKYSSSQYLGLYIYETLH